MQTEQPHLVLNIDKPLEWTSFDVVNRLKGHIKRNIPAHKNIKIGHAGTLDPLATGVLVVCLGKATKSIESLQNTIKEYTGTITIGATTPSYDLETAINETFDYSDVTPEAIQKVATEFIGEQQQIPPLFSAKKVNGVRAYEMAREGSTMELKSNTISIHEFEITHIELPEIDFRVVCSKGTYIRSIAYDFGKKLNNGGHLTKLCRTKSGEFDVVSSLNLNDAIDKINNHLIKEITTELN